MSAKQADEEVELRDLPGTFERFEHLSALLRTAVVRQHWGYIASVFTSALAALTVMAVVDADRVYVWAVIVLVALAVAAGSQPPGSLRTLRWWSTISRRRPQ